MLHQEWIETTKLISTKNASKLKEGKKSLEKCSEKYCHLTRLFTCDAINSRLGFDMEKSMKKKRNEITLQIVRSDYYTYFIANANLYHLFLRSYNEKSLYKLQASR